MGAVSVNLAWPEAGAMIFRRSAQRQGLGAA
jgi:hypothetical protein